MGGAGDAVERVYAPHVAASGEYSAANEPHYAMRDGCHDALKQAYEYGPEYVRSDSVRSVDSVASCESVSDEEYDRNSQPSRLPTVTVPNGWKRLLTNGAIIYISPSNTVLSSLEQVNSYLLTDGNCFCGLDCPLYSHSVFNFDPKVITSPVPGTPGGLSKLCNHKRKRSVASNIGQCSSQPNHFDTLPSTSASRPLINNHSNPGLVKKYAFDISDRRKRRKIMSDPQQQQQQQEQQQQFICEDISMQSNHMMSHNDCDMSAKENNPSVINPAGPQIQNIYNTQINMTSMIPQQPFNSSMSSSRMKGPLFGHSYSQPPYYNPRPTNCNYTGPSNGFPVNQQHQHHQPPQQQPQPQQQPPQASQLHHHHPQQPNQHHHPQQHHPQQHQLQQPQQHLHPNRNEQDFMPSDGFHQGNFCNPMKSMGPQSCGMGHLCGMVPPQHQIPHMGHQVQQPYSMMQYQGQNYQQIRQEPKKHFDKETHMYREESGNFCRTKFCSCYNGEMMQNQEMMQNGAQQYGGHQYAQKPKPQNEQLTQFNQMPVRWPKYQQCETPLPPTIPPLNPYDRVPPLHPHVPPPPVWSEEPIRKKFAKCSKSPSMNAKKVKANYQNSDDVGKMKVDFSHNTGPSFMEDPSGYLAQQTALLNSTISKQTGELTIDREYQSNTKMRVDKGTTMFKCGTPESQKNNGAPQSRTPDSSASADSGYQSQPAANKWHATAHRKDDSPVTSSTYVDGRERRSPAGYRSPIQAGTVSTSNQSPVQAEPSGYKSPIQAGTVSTSHQSPVQPETPSPNTQDTPSPKNDCDEKSVTTVINSSTSNNNSVTSVLAVKANTVVVSVNNAVLGANPVIVSNGNATVENKSPLEMVQNVVSSIQLPSQNLCQSDTKSMSQTSHFLVSNNGQLLVATSNNTQGLTKVNSPMVLNNQVLPTVGMTQQMLGQPTVLFQGGQLVFQPSMMALDSAGNTVQIPQLAVANNVMQSQPMESGAISVSGGGSFSPRPQLASPEKRKIPPAKKRKISPPQMVQIATSTGVVMQPQQNYSPMLQTLILPNKNQFASQPLIVANGLQSVNLVHNIPTIQQFIVPAGLGGMVMTNNDGTATLLPETVHVLAPMQGTTGAMFGNGQSILTSAPGMVLRTQSTPTGTQLRPQISQGFVETPGSNQFIVNGTSTFSSQLNPIVTNSTQQIHYTSPTSRATTQEYIQC